MNEEDWEKGVLGALFKFVSTVIAVVVVGIIFCFEAFRWLYDRLRGGR